MLKCSAGPGNLTSLDYEADLQTFVGQIKTSHPDLPLFMLGHSAEGVVACNYAIDHQEKLAGLICASFAYQVQAPDFALAVLKGISHLFPHAHVLKLKNEDFSRDPAVVLEMNSDPLIEKETQPTQTVAEVARADERLKANFNKITLPVLIIHGSDDKATKPQGSQFFYDNAGSTDKTIKIYEGGYRDLLNDTIKEEVLGDICNWLDERTPVSTEAAAA